VNPANRTTAERQSIAVEYAPGVLDEIRAHVLENFDRVKHGGVESGGVLFGTHSRRMVTVTAMRPASCSYGSGPVFVLGPGDHRDFELTVALHQTDPALAGLEPVGWFLSHVRDSLVLRPSDREIFDRYFDQDWQVVVIMRPGRIGSLRAATIGRGSSPEGVLLNEFTIKQVGTVESPRLTESDARLSEAHVMPVKVARPSPVTERLSGMEPVRTVPDRTPIQAAPARAIAKREAASAVLFRTQLPKKNRGRHWPVLATVAGVLVTAVLAATVYRNASSPTGVGLQAFEREGVMQIEWNPDARSVSRAAMAKLEITQGSATSIRALTREDLRRGMFAALRKQDDVSVRLRLYDADGNMKLEQARYIGRPVVHETPQIIVKEDPQLPNLREQNETLKNELSRERQRAAELERRIRVQQTIIQKRDAK
jgi:hypothetical protein